MSTRERPAGARAIDATEKKQLVRLYEDGLVWTPDLTKPIGPCPTIVLRGWRFAFSRGPFGVGLHLSASLYPPGRGSKDVDWEFLGQVVAVLGAPRDALVTPFETTPPNAVHHWTWTPEPKEAAAS